MTDALMTDALATAPAICDNAPLPSRRSEPSIRHGLQMETKRGLMFEIEAYNRQVDAEDCREGVSALTERRKPVLTRDQRSQPPTGRKSSCH